MIIKIVAVVLEYAILFAMCAFIYRIMRAMYSDLRDKAYEQGKTPANRKAALIVLQSYDKKLTDKRISFSEMLTLGRGDDNNIVLSDAYVSHHHAVISPIKNQYRLEDLDSRNHTYINEAKLTDKVFLQNGDIIKIGTTVFKFER